MGLSGYLGSNNDNNGLFNKNDGKLFTQRSPIFKNPAYALLRGANSYTYCSGFNFNASNISSIYGNSDTVTPESLSCKFFIRYQ